MKKLTADGVKCSLRRSVVPSAGAALGPHVSLTVTVQDAVPPRARSFPGTALAHPAPRPAQAAAL